MQRTKAMSRRSQRGAVLVETAVATPAFLLLFGGMLYFHHSVRAKQGLMSQIKNQVWREAMDGCPNWISAINGVPASSDDSPWPDFTTEMPLAPGSDVSVHDTLGWTSATSTKTTVTVTTGDFHFTIPIDWHAKVICNNNTQSGNIAGVLMYLWPPLQAAIIAYGNSPAPVMLP